MTTTRAFPPVSNRIRPRLAWAIRLMRALRGRQIPAGSTESTRRQAGPPIRIALLLTVTAVTTVPAADRMQFNRDIRPILAQNCYTCHGPDANTRQAGLRLDQRAAATSKLESGNTAIAAGDPRHSALIQRILSTDPDSRMPPADSGKRLTAAQRQRLTTWIEQGAEYQPHWAFVPAVRPRIPAVKRGTWPRNPIDSFVAAQLEHAGLAPAPEAERESLIRRVALDLTGLPPSPEDVQRFVSDRSPVAYTQMVDRYLASPHFGEHMAVHWLDLARYADSNGYQYDTERQQWVWRDWVIDAYNRNQPFDKFTIDQIAGDLLPQATAQQRLATGFNRNHGITIEGGIIDEEYRVEYVMDRLVTTGTVWLGLTIGCARCHEHKYDPITQREFYELFAFFNQVPEKGNSGFAPKFQLPSPLRTTTSQDIDRQIASLRKHVAANALLTEDAVEVWAQDLLKSRRGGWQVLQPPTLRSTRGSELKLLDDLSVLVGGRNPAKDTYELTCRTSQSKLTAVRLETLTHESLPGGGPGRHVNSNFVLSEFELTAVSIEDPGKSQRVKFRKALADYSQRGYNISASIDGSTAGNAGWAVDGPTRKQPASALFIAAAPFGFSGGTQLEFRLRHESGFGTHGIGRPRLAVTRDPTDSLVLPGLPAEVFLIAAKPADGRSESERRLLIDSFKRVRQAESKQLRSRIDVLTRSKLGGVPATMVMQDMAQPRTTYVLERGQYHARGVPVSPGVPAVLGQMPVGVPRNRLGFARWLTDTSHPLTARVTVNRYWQRLFGLGLVKTSEDFGIQGALPSHPELLDWLAVEFVRSGWNVKAMLRLIVTSATYRQSSHVGAEAYAVDPQNRRLARGPRLRLSAEQIRDSALVASGLLVRRLGGKSVYPYQPAGLWLELNNRPGYSQTYPASSSDGLYRRSLYTFWKRTVPSPMLKTFDAPEREFCTVRRSRTNTPLQSLLLLNGPQYVEAARRLGRRMMLADSNSVDTGIRLGFRLITSREPSASELQVLREVYRTNREHFAANPEAAAKLLSVGTSSRDTRLDAATHAAWTQVARMLLNLDEAITKG